MGIIQNHALIVTTTESDALQASVTKVKEFVANLPHVMGNRVPYDRLIVVVPSVVNFSTTVFMAPDGSKEYWEASDVGDVVRAFFVEEMSQHGSVVEVNWGEQGSGMSLR